VLWRILCLGLAIASFPAAAAEEPTPLDTTTPRIAVNQEATDTATRLELLQHDL